MTRQLHDVLNDIASDVPSTDLVAGVASRAARIRWTRRAATAGTAIAVAAVVGLVTVGLPSWQNSTRPDRNVPATQPIAPLLASDIDLDAAQHGVTFDATGLAVVAGPDGEYRTVALELASGRAVVLDAQVPAGLESAHLAVDGSRALLLGSASAVVLDLVSGETLYELPREKQQPVALSWDAQSLITFTRDLTPEAGTEGTPWRLTTIDLATGTASQLGEPLQRSSAAGEIFAAPFGATIFVRYDGSVQDARLHRIDLATGTTLFSETYFAHKTSSIFWSADGSLLAAESTSSVRLMTPSNEVGDIVESFGKVGVPLGFVGPDHLVWWRPGSGGALLVLSDLTGNELPETTSLSTSGSVVAVATALA